MLMHFQSGCPLSSRALHVHQADQRPACKSAQIAARRKVLETSFEGDCEQTCQKCRGKKWKCQPICFMLMKTRKQSITKGYTCHNPFLMFCNGEIHLQHSLNSILNSLITPRFKELSSSQSLCRQSSNFSRVKSWKLLKLKRKRKKKNLYPPPPSFFPVRHFKSSPLVRGIHFHLGVLPSLIF